MFDFKRWLGLGLSLLMLFGLVSLAAAQESATVQVREQEGLGQILTDSQGMTLYIFTRDEANVSNCYDECAENWPPLLVEADVEPTIVEGVPGQLGTTQRTDGGRQVTYNSMPLYYYAADSQPGDVTGQGVGGVWFVVNPTEMGAPAEPEAMVETPAATGTVEAMATPQALPQTGGVSTPWASILLLVVGGLVAALGLGLAFARR